ncbi:MAG: hypothetical protein J6X55_12280 [Victivallales bacterium]|nr:hypothetical protein [Victivallales bacterium]
MLLVKGILCMIVVGMFWTAFGFAMGKAPKKNASVSLIMLVNSLLCMAIAICTAIVSEKPNVPFSVMFWTMASVFIGGIINYFQLDLMSIAMKNGPNGIVWSLIQAGFIFPFSMGILFFGADKTVFNISGVILIIVSLTLFGIAKDINATGKWKLATMSAFVITGACQILGNLPSYFKEAEPVTSTWRTIAGTSGVASGAILCMLIRDHRGFVTKLKEHLSNRSMWLLCAPLVFVSLTNSLFFLYPGMNMLAQANVGSIAYPLAMGSSVVAFEIYTIVLLHEKRNALQITALLIMMLGMVSLCF